MCFVRALISYEANAAKGAMETRKRKEEEIKMKASPLNESYRYRPVLFFALAYLFTWIFWIPAIVVPQELGGILMLIGLLAPAVVSTVFVLASGSELLKKDLKIKVFDFYIVKWRNVLLAILQFAGIVVCSILLSLAFGQSLDQFSFTEDFSFTGVMPSIEMLCLSSIQIPLEPCSRLPREYGRGRVVS